MPAESVADGGPLMAVCGARVDVRLQVMSLGTAAGLLAGRRAVDGSPWHPAYPLADTLVGVSLLAGAHRAAGWDGRDVPPWWIHQIVAADVVVGDIGFHGPPGPDGVVEIGYALVEAVHGRGIATGACRRLLSVAWRDRATAVIAEAAPDNPASRRVLVKAGFVLRDDGVFEARP